MNRDETRIRRMEKRIPRAAERAIRAARKRALETSPFIVEVQEDALYRVFRDGHRELIKAMEPRRRVDPGTRLTLQ